MGTADKIRFWTEGVPVDPKARHQLHETASLDIVTPWVAVMPDVHVGLGATIGSVIPTETAIIPAAVGVDLGCGMMAVQTSLQARHLPDDLHELRTAIEAAVPHGRTSGNRRGDKGSWRAGVPDPVGQAWAELRPRYEALCERHPHLAKANSLHHLGTLGTGNHFIEVCLDEQDEVWFMLHSGSRGVGNRIGTYFIELAKKDMESHMARLPNRNLAYLSEGTAHFDDYVEAVGWAQDFARRNREVLMEAVLDAARGVLGPFEILDEAVNCHHNYVQREHHFGRDLWITRKGAVSARKGQLGIIPGSMGAKSFIVRGKGKEEAFCSCSHGAGRVMSRTQAKQQFSLADHARDTRGVECRKDEGVIDETPKAYKDIDAVMQAQSELVEVVHTLKQVVCVKG